MKTTITIEEELAPDLAHAAETAGVDMNQLVNELLREALIGGAQARRASGRPFKQATYNLGWHSNITWEKIQGLLLQEEAEEYRRLETGS